MTATASLAARPPAPSTSAALVAAGRRRLAGVLTHAAGVAVLLVVWELAGRAGVADGFVVTPGKAVAPLADATDRGTYLRAAGATFGAAGRGLLIGGVLAVLSAIVASQLRPVRRLVAHVAALANSAPWVAVGPVVLVVAGRNSGPVAIAALAVYFYFFVATSVGLAAAEGALRDVFASCGARRWMRVVYLQVPRALPAFFEGVKLAAPAAVAGTVYGEWYGSTKGIGVLLITAMQSGQAQVLWCGSLVAAAGGLAGYGCAAGAQALLRLRYGAGIAAARPSAPRRSRPLVRGALRLAELAVLVGILLAAWHAWITLADVSPLVAPSPSSVFRDLADHPGRYLAAAGHTSATAGTALLLGTAAGLLLAGCAHASRLLAGIAVPGMVLLSATPLVALFPLLARLLGYDGRTVAAIAVLFAVLPVFVYTRSGLSAAAAPHVDLARSYGAGRVARFRHVTLPSALPHIATGVRVAAGSAVISTVVGESLIGRHGLGVDFTYDYRMLDMASAFGSAVCVVVLSLLLFGAFSRLERLVHRHWEAT